MRQEPTLSSQEDAIFENDLITSCLPSVSDTESDPDFRYHPSDAGALLIHEDREHGGGKRTRQTEEERAARIEAQRARTEEIHRKSEAGIEALAVSLAQGKSDTFLALLESLSRFHQYSWGNTMLIALQQPDATLVAGFSTWKEMGRYVKSGEKGIAILAPIPKRVRVDVEEGRAAGEDESSTTSKTAEGRGVRGFKVVFVFDVSQTDGKPLPEFATVQGDPQHFLARLKGQVEAAGITLIYTEFPDGALGRSRGGIIELKPGLSPAREFSVLVHEFAHELLHPLTERAGITKTVKETEAEAVAYVVSRAIGLEPGTAASDYIQLYQGNSSTLAASLERIQKTATRILSDLEEHGSSY